MNTLLEPQIIAETPRWFAVNKPAGWLTIPGRGNPEAPVLLEWLRKRDSQAQVVHRLDRETSGVILFARGTEAHREASLWFQKREIKKIYFCLALGNPDRPVLKIQKAIEGASCTTQVEVKERFGQSFLAQVRPLTGRRHQIRIHLAGEGHPLLGDVSYGGPPSFLDRSGQTISVSRVALHAARIELPTGEKFEASLPEDFSGWLRVLR